MYTYKLQTQCDMDLVQTANKSYFRISEFFVFGVSSMLPLSGGGFVFIFEIIKFNLHPTSYFFRVR